MTAPTPRTFVWDASALHHAAAADRLDVLGTIVSSWRNVTTAAVLEELTGNGLSVVGQNWLEIVHVDGLTELVLLAQWVSVFSCADHNRGEATVLAWAEAHGATAITDDRDARIAARNEGLDVHGTLWIIAEGIRAGTLDRSCASGFVDTLIVTGARYPFGSGQFLTWAEKQGLLPP
ncbi:hypothetical protein [Nonomuraea rhizosphaerae]|uniref:hypothetical protein n=1 Tax=Nonomuraea rhizosphaerae TaxID=2665663 RepID=UPI001C605600|nr:hypothetical protein [Nonomuraea rhizosphaerae]